MRNQESGNGKNGKPFYQLWWFWVIVAVVVVILFGMTRTGSSDNNSSNKASGHTTTNVEKTNSSSQTSKNNLVIDYDKVGIINKKSYTLDFTDQSWDAANVMVNKVTIYKLKSFIYDESNKAKAQGLAIIHVEIDPNRDITAYPDQGTVITDDGQQIDAELISVEGFESNWGGNIAKGAKKSGDVMVPLKKLSSSNSIKSLRLKFDASYDSTDDNDIESDNYDHTYDITLTLN